MNDKHTDGMAQVEPKAAWKADPTATLRDILLTMALNRMDFCEIHVPGQSAMVVSVIIARGDKQPRLRELVQKHLREK